MNETEAVVVRADGGYIWLQPCTPSCEKCADAGACGIGSRASPLRKVRNTVEARVGDTVVIAIGSGAVLRAALSAYLLPLAVGLFGAVIGLRVGGEAVALIGLVGGLALGWFAARGLDRRLLRAGEPLLNLRIKPAVPTLQRR